MATLTALKVSKAKEPGKYFDQGGLMLVVKPTGAASWVLRTMVQGKRYEIGLGSRGDVSLAEARELARETRKKLRAGATPSSLRAEANKLRGMTFADAARRVHAERLPGWKNEKHAAQWISTLETYAFPTLGDVPVAEIGSSHILDVIQPLWLEKAETARRTKQRIGSVLDWAHAKEERSEPAPMRAVDAALKKQKSAPKHFAAMPYEEMPALMAKLSESKGVGALALRFTILTAARSGEVRGATWGEIDLDAKTWTVPGERMKAGEEHIVPLSDAAIDLLNASRMLTDGAPGTIIFPGMRGRRLSDMTLGKALKTAGGDAYTVHGTARSSFRDWAAEQTDFAGDIVEAALAHTIKNKVEAAYRRTNYLEKRRELMAEWCEYMASTV
ncbi:MAG: integrase arm-type DNA-binding domain-containing protein [Pseudomonadota bacterium]